MKQMMIERRHSRNASDNCADTLESYVISMADEIDELGEEERPRLQAEARATLIALREIHWYLQMGRLRS